ncbi:uncharacterized protein C8Q71DRAFT_261629 [Rhodofomes roseus]|uniref:Vacuolar protein sorting-associated protein 9a n=1 Tax=Rhodofomes roseus TaxID=34475 RepID=A0ABQ8K6C7_9APHY|nr:uncharacterized protein C8Q71DRAFT_261629 [Rhodofomes roseus]KAH9832631.1 hypothetical protein C8Q71DRAFT_261629 [Rhodofomes roseus]
MPDPEPPQAEGAKTGHDDLDDALDSMHIGEGGSAVHHIDTEPNPWSDPTSPQPDVDSFERTLHTPDPASLDPTATQGFVSGEITEPHPHASEEILLEFDPLASSEEKAAREAWESSEAHPPPQPPPKDETSSAGAASEQAAEGTSSDQPGASTADSPSAAATAFPSLAALARTFSIPLGGRTQRPRSLETATAVPSPATLSSFAQQQSAPPARTMMVDPENSSATEVSGGSGRSTPGSRDPGRDRGKAVDRDKPPFDFQTFLDQMKVKGAEPVAKFLRSFLSNFAKRTFTVTDQVKLINDFLGFIAERMRETDVWKNASDAEFDNAMEGMEKLVMNRLYDFTFTPAVVRMIPPRPVTVDDLERDRVLSQRIALFKWIEPQHLDVPEGEGSEGFMMFAQQELLKVNHYKAPRDKLICILNSCKVIFGLLRHLHKEEGADTFVPILIYVVLKANPPNLLSNVEFINRFRNPAKLQSEAGYYLSSLMGAVSFVETMDHTSLSNITQEEFEKNVELCIQSLPASGTATPESSTPSSGISRASTPSRPSPHLGEESAQPLALPTPAQVLSEDARRLLQKTGDTLSKPLNAISRIFNEVLDNAEESFSTLPSPFNPETTRDQGQYQQQQLEQDQQLAQHLGFAVPQTPFGAGDGGQQVGGYSTPMQTPYKQRVRRVPSPLSTGQSPGSYTLGSPSGIDTPSRPPRGPAPMSPSMAPPRSASAIHSRPGSADLRPQSAHISRTPTPSLDLAGLQDEIDRAHERAAVAARETLKQIFPTSDPEIMDWVLEANEGDLGKSIEALLEMNSGS